MAVAHCSRSVASSPPQSSRSEEGRTSTCGQAEQLDGRDHRQGQCRKPRSSSDEPRFNGPVTRSSSLALGAERSTWIKRPSWPPLRHFTGILYVPKDLVAAQATYAAHVFYMTYRDSAPVHQAGKCASAQKLWRARVCFKLVPPPDDPRGPPCAFSRLGGVVPARAGRMASGAILGHFPAREKG